MTSATDRADQTLRSSFAQGGRRRHRQSGAWTNSLAALLLTVLSTARLWRARAKFRRELAARSERELQDMGTSWSSIAHEISKPFWRA
jgi:uncharacterized protein YjiS (DUF1127 family)